MFTIVEVYATLNGPWSCSRLWIFSPECGWNRVACRAAKDTDGSSGPLVLWQRKMERKLIAKIVMAALGWWRLHGWGYLEETAETLLTLRLLENQNECESTYLCRWHSFYWMRWIGTTQLWILPWVLCTSVQHLHVPFSLTNIHSSDALKLPIRGLTS